MGKRRLKRKVKASDDQTLRRSARLAGLSPSPVPLINDRLEPLSGLTTPSRSPSTRFTTMRLVIAPPAIFTAGEAMQSPVVVSFEVDVESKGENSEIQAEDDISDCWFMLTLVTEDGQERLTPEREDLLTGKIVDSIHLAEIPEEGNAHTIGHASFENLVISDPGRYCFRIHVINSTRKNPTVLKSHDSVPFDVVEHEEKMAQSSISQVLGVGVEI